MYLWRAREREPIGGLGTLPQWGPGESPCMVEGQGAKPPEADDISLFRRQIIH
jgi:hypothetical protein